MFLTFLIVIICAFILSTYRERVYRVFQTKRITKGTSIPFILFALVIIPVVVMNTFFSERIFYSPKEEMEFAERQEREGLYHQGYDSFAKQNKENPLIQLKFLHFYFEGFLGDFSCGVANRRYDNDTLLSNRIARLFIAVKCESDTLSGADFRNFDINTPGVQYVEGLYYAREGDLSRAAELYREEIILSPDFRHSYIELANVLSAIDPEAYDDFMLEQANKDYLSYQNKNSYFFNNGHWVAYFTNIFVNRTFSAPLFVMFIAFVVSFIWIFYLRLMDVYNREKWLNIMVVFLLGGLFTNLCLPIYDYAYYQLEFYINGEVWNDFWYCVLIIGGSEELVKCLPWLIFGFAFGRFKEPFDYVIYASVSALGFAFIENFDYLENYGSISSRAIVTSVAHMFDSVIVAYAMIIARYRMKNKSVFKKVGVVFLGFIIAMLAHGFYDFWLISDAVSGLYFLTFLFFILSLHLWFFFKKNAMNHSPFFTGNEKFNVALQLDALYIAIVGIVMLQYVVIAAEYGAQNVNRYFIREVGIAGLFLFYMTNQLNNFKLVKGVWSRFSFKDVIPNKRIGQIMSKISEFSFGSMLNFRNSKSEEFEINKDLRGLQLRLFAPKSNRYIGNQLPVKGYCSMSLEVSERSGWYLFRLDSPVYCQDFVTDQIIIKPKDAGKSLLDDKIEIYFMFIPSVSILQKNDIRVVDLRAAGKCYSRPLNAIDFY